jgi:predicted ATPase
MKLKRLKINSDFKNLAGVELHFSETESRTVIIGQNGTGKSNILEAIVHIFLRMDDGLPPDFSYELEYKLGDESLETWVKVEADLAQSEIYKIQAFTLDDQGRASEPENLTIKKVKRDDEGLARYLPRNVFAYYSGPSDRLENLFFQKRKDFYHDVIKKDSNIRDNIRPFFYAKAFHSQFSLLAFFSARGFPHARQFLKRELAISDFESATFYFKDPEEWGNKNANDFWGAKGAVREFLELLKKYSVGPISAEEPIQDLFSSKPKKREVVSYHIPDLQSLERLANNMRPEDFFKILEATYLSGVLDRIEIKVTLEGRAKNVSFTELSEGEQQLLTVFGLLQFTAKRDALFLLDEPDTHLNPYWAAKYHQILEMFVPEGFVSHILMTTHHPLSIYELNQEQIQVVTRSEQNQKISVSQPKLSPKGMTVNGILTSDMFGLLTTLDQSTQQLIRERRELLANNENYERLEVLNKELEELGYGYIHPDEDYRQFLIARSKYLRFEEEVASVEARKQLVKSLLKDLGVSGDEAH